MCGVGCGCVYRRWSVGWRFEAGGRKEEEGRKARGLGRNQREKRKEKGQEGRACGKKKKKRRKKVLGRGELG